VSSEVGKEDTTTIGSESISECKRRGKETRRNMGESQTDLVCLPLRSHNGY
jgi:hypothetical protein